MKLALVSGGGYIGGKEVISLEFANGLRDAGYDVEIVATLWTNGEFPRRLRVLGHHFTQMRLGYISGTLRWNEMRMTAHQLVYLPALWWGFARFLQRFQPTRVVHTNWHHLLLLLPFLRRSRDLFWVHETLPNKARYRKLFSIFSRRISRFIAVSNAVGKSITDLGVPAEQVVVIHNGLAPFPIAERSSNSPNIRIGIVGQVGEWKGHEDLVEAFADVIKTFPQSELHIFGDAAGPYANHLRFLIGRLSLDDHVRWRGFESDRSKIYSKIDICVVPSRFEEPFGLVAAEAAMTGLPCVATRSGGLPEIVEDNVTGLLVDAKRPDQLATALIALLENPDRRRGMGIAAQDSARKRFTRDRLVKQFADLLEK